ncbi:DUF72 domain-containing protein [Deinococcus peraridilitoris]|uniref:DUF72 domain-containing protein n=1 Tax=Deinococcus peraridilitoris (strain DSM 19664 / LMG 22246 / CIP 109416 / KR-200) TaxID=937777 RepID=L0A5W5_DEIPD|nr:DUF72 domain-containing protein [Deinococcus peraridilitoris]AFZ68557.1 hypothetical protein Deipe_3111 [Deinococcus peraridilitoris DSM 19664]
MRIYMGTGGYANDEWLAPSEIDTDHLSQGWLYPAGTKKPDFLSVYAQHFNAVELNSSFYGIPGLKAFEGMARRSAGRTRFAVKLHQVFTHARKPETADFDRMLQSPEPLREAGLMGPYLAQFPYSFHRTAENRKYLLDLAERFAGRELAVELRHASWDKPEVREGMGEFGLIWVSPDYPPVGGMPEPRVYATSEVGYLRLHGRNKSTWWEGGSAAERHDYLYNRAEIDEWADKIAEVAGELEELYIFFENTTKGHALKNIPMLREALESRGLGLDRYPND